MVIAFLAGLFAGIAFIALLIAALSYAYYKDTEYWK